MKIGRQLFLVLGATVASGVGLGLVGVLNVADLKTQQENMYRQNVAAMDSLMSVSQDALKIQLTVRDMLLTPSRDQRERLEDLLKSLNQHVILNLSSFQTDMVGAFAASDSQILGAFRTAYDGYQVQIKNIVSRLDEGKTAEALDVLQGEGAEQARAMGAALEGLVALNTRLAQVHYDSGVATADRATASTWGLLILSTVFSLGAALFLTRSLAAPLVATAALAGRLADGDLTVRSQKKTAGRKDEMGTLARSVDTLAASLTRFVQTLRETEGDLGRSAASLDDRARGAAEAAGRIAAAAETGHGLAQEQSSRVGGTTAAVGRIVGQVETFDRLIEDQVASVTQTTSSIEEMTSNIRSLSGQAAGLGRAFSDLRTTSDDGRDQLFAIVDKINSISTQSGRLADANDTVKDIAGQTNILSMNAAIEAAHAGSAGAGFAVVADEIRKLAEQTAVHSAAITQEVTAIRTLIAQTSTDSEAAKSAFAAVLARIGDLGRFEAELTTALAEQGQGAQQILEATTKMAGVSAAVRRGSSEILGGSRDISREIGEVQELGTRMQTHLDGILADGRAISAASDGVLQDSARNRGVSTRLEEVVAIFRL